MAGNRGYRLKILSSNILSGDPMVLFNIIFGLALMIIGYLLMPKPKKEKPREVSELESPTADTSSPWSVVFGDIVFKEMNYLWWGDKSYARHSKKSEKK